MAFSLSPRIKILHQSEEFAIFKLEDEKDNCLRDDLFKISVQHTAERELLSPIIIIGLTRQWSARYINTRGYARRFGLEGIRNSLVHDDQRCLYASAMDSP